MLKRCSQCKLRKEATEFRLRSGRKAHLHRSWCKACEAVKAKQWLSKNPDKVKVRRQKYYKANPAPTRRRNLWVKFKLTLEQYEALHSAQEGLCAICKLPCASGRRLAVDHRHASGSIRGLLCIRCNTGLGKFKDSPELLRIAARYLETHA